MRATRCLASLMLHGVIGDCELPLDQSAEDAFYDVREQEFLVLLDMLIRHNLKTVTVGELNLAAQFRRVLVSFDDGRASDHAVALPAMLERHMRGVFFVTTDWIGKRGFMDKSQLRDLVASGMDVQAHGKSHRFLSELADGELRGELGDAKAALEDITGQEVTGLAYPGGRGNRRVRAIAYDMGFRHFFCSRPGWYREGRSEIPRMVVHSATSMDEIERYIDGHYGPVVRQVGRHYVGRVLRGILGPNGYSALKGALRN